MAAPSISGITPSSGPTGGGTGVTISGTNFTGATSVAFGGTAAASYTVEAAGQISATTPAHAAGGTQVTVTTPGGKSTQLVFFTFIAPAVPLLTGITPNRGPVVGGTTVALTGAHFAGATGVRFGATPAASFTVDTASRITATAPATAAGVQRVTVTTPDGTSNPLPFFYLGAPVINVLDPVEGPQAGGTTVLINGCNLGAVTSVRFGAAPATFTVRSATEITATAPAGTGVSLVTAAGPGGTSAAAYYTYLAGPVVSGLDPAVGPESGGTTVTITGSALGLARSVTFGGVPASLTAFSDAMLGAVAPPGTGTVPLVVTTPGGTGAGPSYTYLPPP